MTQSLSITSNRRVRAAGDIGHRRERHPRTAFAAARQAELDNRDPAQKYFINEALDELFERSK